MGERVGTEEQRRAISLLVAMLGDDVKPFELLAAHCASDGADAWVRTALAGVPSSRVPLATWEDLKRHSKRECAPDRIAVADAAAMAGLLRYCVSIAGALCDHGALVSSMPRADVERMLALIGPLLPDPWAEVFAQALSRARAVQV